MSGVQPQKEVPRSAYSSDEDEPFVLDEDPLDRIGKYPSPSRRSGKYFPPVDIRNNSDGFGRVSEYLHLDSDDYLIAKENVDIPTSLLFEPGQALSASMLEGVTILKPESEEFTPIEFNEGDKEVVDELQRERDEKHLRRLAQRLKNDPMILPHLRPKAKKPSEVAANQALIPTSHQGSHIERPVSKPSLNHIPTPQVNLAHQIPQKQVSKSNKDPPNTAASKPGTSAHSLTGQPAKEQANLLREKVAPFQKKSDSIPRAQLIPNKVAASKQPEISKHPQGQTPANAQQKVEANMTNLQSKPTRKYELPSNSDDYQRLLRPSLLRQVNSPPKEPMQRQKLPRQHTDPNSKETHPTDSKQDADAKQPPQIKSPLFDSKLPQSLPKTAYPPAIPTKIVSTHNTHRLSERQKSIDPNTGFATSPVPAKFRPSMEGDFAMKSPFALDVSGIAPNHDSHRRSDTFLSILEELGGDKFAFAGSESKLVPPKQSSEPENLKDVKAVKDSGETRYPKRDKHPPSDEGQGKESRQEAVSTGSVENVKVNSLKPPQVKPSDSAEPAVSELNSEQQRQPKKILSKFSPKKPLLISTISLPGQPNPVKPLQASSNNMKATSEIKPVSSVENTKKSNLKGIKNQQSTTHTTQSQTPNDRPLSHKRELVSTQILSKQANNSQSQEQDVGQVNPHKPSTAVTRNQQKLLKESQIQAKRGSRKQKSVTFAEGRDKKLPGDSDDSDFFSHGDHFVYDDSGEQEHLKKEDSKELSAVRRAHPVPGNADIDTYHPILEADDGEEESNDQYSFQKRQNSVKGPPRRNVAESRPKEQVQESKKVVLTRKAKQKEIQARKQTLDRLPNEPLTGNRQSSASLPSQSRNSLETASSKPLKSNDQDHALASKKAGKRSAKIDPDLLKTNKKEVVEKTKPHPVPPSDRSEPSDSAHSGATNSSTEKLVLGSHLKAISSQEPESNSSRPKANTRKRHQKQPQNSRSQEYNPSSDSLASSIPSSSTPSSLQFSSNRLNLQRHNVNVASKPEEFDVKHLSGLFSICYCRFRPHFKVSANDFFDWLGVRNRLDYLIARIQCGGAHVIYEIGFVSGVSLSSFAPLRKPPPVPFQHIEIFCRKRIESLFLGVENGALEELKQKVLVPFHSSFILKNESAKKTTIRFKFLFEDAPNSTS